MFGECMNHWKLHYLSDNFFGCENLDNGVCTVYTFGDRCQPLVKNVCINAVEAKSWVVKFGDKRG